MYHKNGGKVLQRHTNHAATSGRSLDLHCDRHLQLSKELAERCVSSAKVQADTAKELRAAVARQDLRAAAKANVRRCGSRYSRCIERSSDRSRPGNAARRPIAGSIELA